MIQKLLNIQMIWMMFIKIFMNTIQIKNEKYWGFFDDMIADMLSNKKLNPIVYSTQTTYSLEEEN